MLIYLLAIRSAIFVVNSPTCSPDLGQRLSIGGSQIVAKIPISDCSRRRHQGQDGESHVPGLSSPGRSNEAVVAAVIEHRGR